jgi:hypothetical protein
MVPTGAWGIKEHYIGNMGMRPGSMLHLFFFFVFIWLIRE